MKKPFLLFTLLFSITLLGQVKVIEPLINLNSNSATYESSRIHVYKWEAYTPKGALIFGVSKSKAEADWIIKDFAKRNAKSAYEPIGQIIKKFEAPSSDFYTKFKKKYPKGYKVLMPRDVIALRMIKISGINDAADFIESMTKKSHDEAFQYVFKLSNNFKSYSISSK